MSSAVLTAPVAAPHPLLRATALSSVIGLVAGLTVGLLTQASERDRG
ncbi:MAG: hypothetical protein H7231_03950 [Rhodoferax sp.]|nr:hypothetical protein [Actinomycetota bacterium]